MVINLVGQIFGDWLVLERRGSNKHRCALFLCRCSCGLEKTVSSNHLRMGQSTQCKSCSARKAKTGLKFSKTHRKNMSNAQLGKLNHSWDPNITDEERELMKINSRSYPEYKNWRKAVYERDNYTCQKCGSKKGGTLVAHHLDSYAKNKDLRTTLTNGITLCKDCHKTFHHQYGQITSKKQFKEFINE